MSNFYELRSLFIEQVLPHIGKVHLDFGCGFGLGSYIEAVERPDSQIVGYDINPECILNASRYARDNLKFVDSKSEICRIGFDSAGANFVFHEQVGILEEISAIVRPGTVVYILDYNMRGVSERQFRKRFCFDNEKRVMRDEGVTVCYQKHTATGVDDCIKAGVAAGFKNVSVCPSKNYFVWIGRRG